MVSAYRKETEEIQTKIPLTLSLTLGHQTLDFRHLFISALNTMRSEKLPEIKVTDVRSLEEAVKLQCHC